MTEKKRLPQVNECEFSPMTDYDDDKYGILHKYFPLMERHVLDRFLEEKIALLYRHYPYVGHGRKGLRKR